MSKKGFTLVELLGVIAIMGILITIATGVYTKVFDNQKEHTYKNKVSTIELAAEKWAEETNLTKATTITVKRLVAESFYQADKYNEDTKLVEVLDPRDDSSMLCNTIDITIENGVTTAKFTGNKDCNLSNQEEERTKVKIAAYEYDTVNKKAIKVLKNKDDVNFLLPWTRHAVLLVVEPTEEGYKDYTKVIYTNGAFSETKEVVNDNRIGTANILEREIDFEKYANTYLVDAELFLNTEYNVAIDLPKSSDDDKIYGLKSNDITVRIDKEAPSITVGVEGDYTTSSTKTVTIKGSDGSGSGLKTFYVTTSPNGHTEGELMNDPTKPLIDNTLEIELGLGVYYVYAEDNVGNVSNNDHGKGPERIEIINIDDTTPSCVISITKGTIGKNGWYTSDVELTFTTSLAGATGYNYYFGTSEQEVYNGGIASGYVKEKESTTKTYKVTNNGTQQYYGYIKTPLGVTTKCDTTGINGGKGLRIDKEPPKISPKRNPLTLGSESYTFTNNINVVCGVSGLDRLVCVPPESRRTGTYTVTCTATCKNGLSSSTSFQTLHSYDAIWTLRDSKIVTSQGYVYETCKPTSNCWQERNPGEIQDKGPATKCVFECDGSRGKHTMNQWTKYYCGYHPLTCPGGINFCSGDYYDCGNGKDCCIDGVTEISTTQYYCENRSLTIDGHTYGNVSGTMFGSYCYYCPKGGTFNSYDKKCYY